MKTDPLEDKDLLTYLRRSEQPDFDKIVFFARKHGVKTPDELWQFHDRMIRYWKEFKSTEGDFTY